MTKLFTIKDNFKENELYLNRTVAALIIVASLLFILIIRMVYLQINQHDVYTTLSKNNQVKITPISPTRGIIFDRNGVVLANNITAFSLKITPSRQESIEDTISELSKFIVISDTDKKNFYTQIKYKGHNSSIPLKVKLSETEVAKFAVEQHRFPGVEVGASLVRHYPQGEIFAHTLGYLGPISENDLYEIDTVNYKGTDFIGKTGLEKYYEDILHGKVGYQQIETDARGKTIRVLGTNSPLPGANIKLTIDSNLQKIAHEALGKNKGAVVAIDTNTGAILAMVSKPSFDPNIFVQGISNKTFSKLTNSKNKPLFNRAIRGQYPPGSTIKPLVAIQGLEQKVIDPKTSIFDPGWYKLEEDGRLYRDWLRQGHGWMNLESAIAQSCTTYFYILSHKLGVDNLHNIFTKFGLGFSTGIDLPGEAEGLVPSKEWKKLKKHSNWYIGETLNTGIGQGYMLATPLQIANVGATIANRGKIYRPQLVKMIDDENVVANKPSSVINLTNDKNWDTIIKAMRKTISHSKGTAHKIHDENNHKIAGKTGTAQVFSLKQDQYYKEGDIKANLRDHSWFMAFAPMDNPQVAIAVIIENDHGSSKVAKTIIDNYLAGKK